MKKKILFVLLATALFGLISNAQKSSSFNSDSYTTALGVKFYPGSISLKHFIENNTAL